MRTDKPLMTKKCCLGFHELVSKDVWRDDSKTQTSASDILGY